MPLHSKKPLRPFGLRFAFGQRGVLALLLACILATILLISPLRYASNAAMLSLGSGIWRGVESITGRTDLFSSLFANKRTLHATIETLTATIEKQQQELSLARRAFAENEELRTLIGRASSTQNVVFARVLKKPHAAPHDTLIVDAGKRDGVTPGQFVFSNSSTILGRVEVATQTTAKIQLFSFAGLEHDVLLGEQQISAIAYGVGGGMFVATVPRDTAIAEHDVVRLAASPEFKLATIALLEQNTTDPLERVFFRLDENINELTWVGVLTSPESQL